MEVVDLQLRVIDVAICLPHEDGVDPEVIRGKCVAQAIGQELNLLIPCQAVELILIPFRRIHEPGVLRKHDASALAAAPSAQPG